MAEADSGLTTVEARCEITDWNETPYEEPDQSPKLTRVTILKRYDGAIEGNGATEVLSVQGCPG
jgi:Protein of unknown function (DUF3224)